MPKYPVGTIVEVLIERGSRKWNWAGEVIAVDNCGDDVDPDWEYTVSGGPALWPHIPLLAWESELTEYKK